MSDNEVIATFMEPRPLANFGPGDTPWWECIVSAFTQSWGDIKGTWRADASTAREAITKAIAEAVGIEVKG